MKALFHRRLSPAVVLFLLTAAAPAQAQQWLQDRSQAEGRGVQVGDLELHPGIGAEIGYDSNVFYEEQDPESSVILRVTPHLLLSTRGPQRRGEGEQRGTPPRIAFRGGVSASYYHYFSDRAKDNVEGDLSLQLTINPERPFSVFLFEQFTRTIRPFTEAEDTTGGTTFARDQNQVGVRFQLATVGNVLQARLGYMFGIDYFEDEEFAFARSLTHTIELGSNFRFLPQTGIVYDARLDIQTYPNDGAMAMATSNVSDNVRLQTRVGLNGALTTRLSLMGLVGYSAGFYETREEFDSVIGVLEARWQASETTRFTIGYDRTFFPSFVGNFFRRDRGYANLQLMIAGSFLLGLEGSAGYLDYGIPVATDGTPLGSSGADPSRQDVRLTAGIFAEYRATDWFGVNTTLRYTANITDYQYMVMGPTGTIIDPAEYSKFEAFLGVRAFY